ncbi:MAG: methyltransferase [Rhodobacteraceae bacterium]|nr:methyltransferase [Paracoccaceae bacterium]
MARSRLSTAIADGTVVLPQVGRILVLRPSAGMDLSALPSDRVQIVQGFRPDHDYYSAAGFETSATIAGQFALAIVCLPRSKDHARALLAQAHLVTDGPLVLDGQKTDGIDSMLKALKQRASVSGVVSMAHGKLVVVEEADLSDWQPAPQTTPEGFVTTPGAFSADGVDRASALLAGALPGKMGPLVADLGAGWGYLSHAVLDRDGVAEVHLIEAEHDALEAARQNVTNPRARFHWADVTRLSDDIRFDDIVTNPPFHTARAADPALGRAFIATAARLLAPQGALWLVANRHLPYEAALAEGFGEVEEVGGDAGFKLIRASRPVSANRKVARKAVRKRR